MFRALGLGFLFALVGLGLADKAGMLTGIVAGALLYTAHSLSSRQKTLSHQLEAQELELRWLKDEVQRMRRAIHEPPSPPQAQAVPSRAISSPIGSAPADAPLIAPQEGPRPPSPEQRVATATAVTSAPLPTKDDNASEQPAPPAPPLTTAAATTTAARPTPKPPVAQRPLAVEPSAQRTVGRDSEPGVAGIDPFAPIQALLFGGNTVVRMGILILVVGLGLLVKYAADNDLLPIELRLSAATAMAIALITFGFRQRHQRAGFAHALQGGGVAALYLIVFFSYRAYELLPAGLALPLLIIIGGLSAALAVLQDAMSLSVIGVLGGFWAPILASTGGGNHVALFSYYLILNLGIFAVALRRAFRPLNLLGFVFTFGIGAAWGALRYVPEHFASTEPFLIAFFLLYVAIPVLYALRHPSDPASPSAPRFADGTLIFGVPLATLLMQGQLVGERPFGMALSTLAMSAVYVALALVLRRRAPQALSHLIASFSVLAVGFATLAVPYGFSNHNLTGATWALEGAGLYFLGVRQQRQISRLSGIILQPAALIALLIARFAHHSVDAEQLPFLNIHTIAPLLIAASSFFVARHAYAHRTRLPTTEWQLLQGFILFGWSLYCGAMHTEVSLRVRNTWHDNALLSLIAVLGLVMEPLAARLRWLPGRVPTALLLPLTSLILAQYWLHDHRQPLADLGLLAFPLLLLAGYLSLFRFAPVGGRYARLQQPFAVMAPTLLLAIELRHVCQQEELGVGIQGAALHGGFVAALWITLQLSRTDRFPCQALFARERAATLLGLCALVVVHGFTLCLRNGGDASPLPNLPLLNPLDIAQILAILILAQVLRAKSLLAVIEAGRTLPQAGMQLLGALAFVLFNVVLARAVHHLAEVPYALYPLWTSSALQMALSISWTLTALGLMWTAHRRVLRTLWIIGAALLAVVVVKLFLVDLSQLGTVAKIATFLVVGLLLLAVGYVAPVPPTAANNDNRRSQPDTEEELDT